MPGKTTAAEDLGIAGGQKGHKQFSNPITILKRRLAKIQATNVQKRKLIEQYIRNVKVIADAFDQIKEKTGIQAIDEIVTTIVKAEEQNYSLYNYVNRLNTETDKLEETNKDRNREIQAYKQEMQQRVDGREHQITALQDEIRAINDSITNSIEEKEVLHRQLQNIYENVDKMVKMFKRSRFFLSVAQRMSYDEGVTFTETNITQYLAELEEHISSLITYVAFKHDDQHAAIAAIPLDKLPRNTEKAAAKEGIEITQTQDLDTDQLEKDVGVPPSEEQPTSEAQMRRRFDAMLERGGIKSITECIKN